LIAIAIATIARPEASARITAATCLLKPQNEKRRRDAHRNRRFAQGRT